MFRVINARTSVHLGVTDASEGTVSAKVPSPNWTWRARGLVRSGSNSFLRYGVCRMMLVRWTCGVVSVSAGMMLCSVSAAVGTGGKVTVDNFAGKGRRGREDCSREVRAIAVRVAGAVMRSLDSEFVVEALPLQPLWGAADRCERMSRCVYATFNTQIPGH